MQGGKERRTQRECEREGERDNNENDDHSNGVYLFVCL